MLYFILVLLFMNAFSIIGELKRPTNSHKASGKRSFASVVFSNTNNLRPSDKKPCQWLSRLKHQNKLCWKRGGLSEILLKARNLALTECRNLFRFHDWNCTKWEFYFKKVYRVTAFMHSIASSAVMFSIARACSEGTLAGCTCGKHGKVEKNVDWHWSGCGDNTKYARKLTKTFLQLKRKKEDEVSALIKYNTELGIKVVEKNERRECKCHGVSNSCSLKTCFKYVGKFEEISSKLKTLYHDAEQVQRGNTVRFSKSESNQRLLFLEDDPNLCSTTANRWCSDEANCATLCCGRGFYKTQVVHRNEKCDCIFRKENIWGVTCGSCDKTKTFLKCNPLP